MLDLNKPITARDGRSVRIICTDRVGDKPLVALILSHQGNDENSLYLYKDGRWHQQYENHCDLINPKVKKEGWINIYSDGCLDGDVFKSPEEASSFVTPDEGCTCTTIKIEWEE